MKKERCMLFFDIDGTLITTDGKRTFPESAKRALREARERGHLVYINTGRVMEMWMISSAKSVLMDMSAVAEPILCLREK